MRTVITHFHNEEYLLPFWLRHHREMFDHGILIDHHSTDGSADIVRELVPGWTLVRSENADFDAIECDFEVMLHERTAPGWKVALTATEFLCCASLEAAEAVADAEGERGFAFEAAVMVDAPGVAMPALRPDLPLPLQRSWGYLEGRHPTHLGRGPYHRRLYHRYPHGSYLPGRHATNRRVIRMHMLGLVLWYGFSPWDEAFLRRKLQIGARVPQADRASGRGAHHLRGLPELEERRAHAATVAHDLRAEPLFQEAVGTLRPVLPQAPCELARG